MNPNLVSMPPLSRRRFLQVGAAGVSMLLTPGGQAAFGGRPQAGDDRIEGLLTGCYLGDALGGPVEFQPLEKSYRIQDPLKRWEEGETLDAAAIRAAGSRLRLRGYSELRPEPEPYAHWTRLAPEGTVTDDSRHKFVLLEGLRRAEKTGRWPFEAKALAQAYLDWPLLPPQRRRRDYDKLRQDWLLEWQLASRWVLGSRDLALARPPERMWIGLPTCCGQMTLPPLAAVHAGRPAEAYRAAHQLAFFDNGFGRDLNASLQAGLAAALATTPDPSNPRAAWETIAKAMTETDPYGYLKVPWTHRAIDRWLGLAHRRVKESGGCPFRLFEAMNRDFLETTKWEAQVPVVVTFACLEITGYDPLASIQLALEWGHDSDSYAALMAAFLGALHGPSIFPSGWRQTLRTRLRLDYEVDLDEDVRLLKRLQDRALRRNLFGA